MVANSTTLSSSVSATATTMSVINAGGFVVNEILVAKATSSTGFFTEYLKVEAVNSSSEPHTLYVARGLSKGGLAISGAFEPGQVLVSQAVSGSGFIHMNAAPSCSSIG